MIGVGAQRAAVLGVFPILTATWILGAACGVPEPPAEEAEQPAVELPEPFDPAEMIAARDRMAVPRTDLSVPDAFAHEAHREVVCSVCHEAVPGHTTHAQVECTDCHPAAVPSGEAVVVGEAECLACHHVEQTIRDCAGCHPTGTLLPRTVPQTLLMSVWEAPKERRLPFDHARHTELACSECHGSDALQALDTECASCHEEHHEPVDRCGACHLPDLLDAHDASAHRGCGGAGCHVESEGFPPPSRARCVSCHTEQIDHEPGLECVPCHAGTDMSAQPGRIGLEPRSW